MNARGRESIRVVEILQGAGVGGTERHVRSLLGGLRGHAIDPILVVSETGPLLDLARESGLESYLIPRSSARQYVRDLGKTLGAIRPQAVHAHSGRLACLVARRARVPLVIETRHGARCTLPRPVGFPGTARMEGFKCRLAHRTIAVCESDRQWLIGPGGLPEDRVVTVHNGIAPAAETDSEDRAGVRRELGIPPEGRWLGLVARLTPDKAPQRALELLATLRRDDPDWRLAVVGTGPLEPAMQRRARELAVDDAVAWLGADPRGSRLMQAIDCLCLPSRMEGLPYVVLEGLAAGVPIVATPAGGVGEALAGDVLGRGCLPWDPGTWAARVRDLSAAEARANWSRAAHAGLLAFTEDEMLSRLAAIYRGRPVGAAQGTEERPRPPVQRRVEP